MCNVCQCEGRSGGMPPAYSHLIDREAEFLQLHAFHLEWSGTEPLGFVCDFVGREKESHQILTNS